MAFRPSEHSTEEWLRLENDGLLQKICNIHDSEGFLVEQYKTRITIVPFGVALKYGSSAGQKWPNEDFSPALYRTFNIDDEGNIVGSVPVMREWTQECEDRATGGIVDPEDPTGLPAGLRAATATYVSGVASAVIEGASAIVASITLLPDEELYLRHVMVSGENQAKFQVLIDGSPMGTKRTWFGNFNEDFWFNTANGGILLKNEEVVQVSVLNCGDGDADFESSIGYVVKING